ncbi:MAG: NAD(P)-dependent oxidoreductase [Planctomycetota bacterium]|nr:MAG: NAD(P)-dependent oxidoreductase [Planctomycetota bacterium]
MAETRVGFCGLGTMGAAMAANVARAGFPLTVWNRTPGRAEAPLAAGATEATSPATAAAASDVVVICVSDTPDVEAVLFGQGGLTGGLAQGALVIDCSTIAPAATREFAERLAESGVGFVDAPVSGGSEGAEKGTLTIMVGGSDEDVARAQPVLEAMGASITHMGPSGAGQATKAVNQVILSGVYLGVAEGMVLAMKSGLDAGKVAEALAGGAAGSWVLNNRSSRMIEDEYPLGFRIALHLKDLGIALEQAREVGAALPVAAMAAQIEAGLVARGHGDDDNSALARAIREWSGL